MAEPERGVELDAKIRDLCRQLTPDGVRAVLLDLGQAGPTWVYAATAARIVGLNRRTVMDWIMTGQIDCEPEPHPVQTWRLVRLDQVRERAAKRRIRPRTCHSPARPARRLRT